MTQNNEKAFPCKVVRRHEQGGTTYNTYEQGMDLRDWFAGQALNGFLANGIEQTAEHVVASGLDDLAVVNGIAELCYITADAMMKAREVDND